MLLERATAGTTSPQVLKISSVSSQPFFVGRKNFTNFRKVASYIYAQNKAGASQKINLQVSVGFIAFLRFVLSFKIQK
jgi:hypothetical protein